MSEGIDLAAVRDKAELHAAIARQGGFPATYGANLDALYDVVSEPRAVDLVFYHYDALPAGLRADFFGVIAVLEEAMAVNPRLNYVIVGAPEDRDRRSEDAAEHTDWMWGVDATLEEDDE